LCKSRVDEFHLKAGETHIRLAIADYIENKVKNKRRPNNRR